MFMLKKNEAAPIKQIGAAFFTAHSIIKVLIKLFQKFAGSRGSAPRPPQMRECPKYANFKQTLKFSIDSTEKYFGIQKEISVL